MLIISIVARMVLLKEKAYIVIFFLRKSPVSVENVFFEGQAVKHFCISHESKSAMDGNDRSAKIFLFI